MTSPVRMVTASALFDGHDVSINLFRRLFQKAGAEVIHIGHNRSVEQLVATAIQEDADAVCVSSYQGGHMEFFRYLRQRLNEEGGTNIAVLGGGGGTILPSEIETLRQEGAARLYHAEEARKLGLRGLIHEALQVIKRPKRTTKDYQTIITKLNHSETLNFHELALAISAIEREEAYPELLKALVNAKQGRPGYYPPVLGITGPGGAGKSSLIDELVQRFLYTSPQGRIGILAFDPMKRKTGGALLGDRIRMNSVYNPRVFMRSMATKGSTSAKAPDILALMKHGGFDLLIVETTGTGQGDVSVLDLCDRSLYVMTNEYGASSQLEKIDMLDYADLVALNKADKRGSEDALDDIRYVYADSRGIKFTPENKAKLPVFATIASDFNDPGVTTLYRKIVELLLLSPDQDGLATIDLERLHTLAVPKLFNIIPPERTFYLGEIADTIRRYKHKTETLSAAGSRAYKFNEMDKEGVPPERIEEVKAAFGKEGEHLIESYEQLHHAYQQKEYLYSIRGYEKTQPLTSGSLSGTQIPKIALPHYKDWGEICSFMRRENFPGHYPFTAGVFPFKNVEEEPKRQFAGEGPPERTNARFHYLCEGEQAHRLSTAFDSVTLYGEDPAKRPDIYGKIGNSGVSIATLDDMKALYKGFDLTDPLTSVSLTINGPAPIILALFLNTAIDFAVEKERSQGSSKTYEEIKKETLHAVRGTVQADILKEEQAQNTCIFSSKFALKMMGDIQEYFEKHKMEHFYSVSISGYHIAEAGANPITQLALTLANGFTYIEYYLSRGLSIDQFAHNLSFFFSSGLDAEYAVIGRVARRIWAIALREKYGANDRSCKLKYHIQTSGRSLHAQEIAFNDIRTTLQALTAFFDRCNSLHTNAYDEAVTTPTEESVRRAMAIQLILTKEFGPLHCDNPTQGSFFWEQLTDLVEEAVLSEFDAISRRGGVLGAMERQYQRHKIQSESLHYELKKSSGELPIIGVNTFLSPKTIDYEKIDIVRATEAEKEQQITRTRSFIERAGPKNTQALERLRAVALSGANIFEELMETVKYASLGQISHTLYSCGGQYRRSM